MGTINSSYERFRMCSFFIVTILLAVAGVVIPMDRPPYQLSHPSTWSPVMIEGGLAGLFLLLAFVRAPSPERMLSFMTGGSLIWLAATHINQNFVDFALRVPLGLLVATNLIFCWYPNKRSAIRSAALWSFFSCLAVTLAIHYVLLFPVNKHIDIQRLEAVRHGLQVKNMDDCQIMGSSCFYATDDYPSEISDGERQMIASYVGHGDHLEQTIQKVVLPDAVNTQSDYRLYGFTADNGRVRVVLSDHRHFIDMRLFANNTMMALLGFSFPIITMSLLLAALRRESTNTEDVEGVPPVPA